MPSKHRGVAARINAWFLNHGTGAYNRLVDERKKRLFGNLSGRVLEIGAGTGANLKYYPGEVELTVLDPNPYMRKYFEEEAGGYGIPFQHKRGKAEQMPFADETFDHVVTTLVLCSVDNMEDGLNEMYRVLKPGGSYHFIEHVAAPKSSWLYTLQRAIRPFWKCMAEGCRPDRDTWKFFQESKFGKIHIEHFWLRLPVVSPHVMGWVKKK